MEASDDTGSVRSATHCSAEEVDNSRQCAHQQNPLNEELAETVAPTGEITCSSSTASDCIQQRPTASNSVQQLLEKSDNCYAFWPDSFTVLSAIFSGIFAGLFRGFFSDMFRGFISDPFGIFRDDLKIRSGFVRKEMND